jgi:hypothetical protein
MAQVEVEEVLRSQLEELKQAENQCRVQLGTQAENLLDVQFWRGSIQAIKATQEAVIGRLNALQPPEAPSQEDDADEDEFSREDSAQITDTLQ